MAQESFKLRGIFLPQNKNILYAFSKITGLNKYRLKLSFLLSGISLYKKIENLSAKEIQELSKILDRLNFSILTDLTKEVKEYKVKSLNIKSLKGYRLMKGLPVRGQRTKNNSKTAKKLNKI